MHRSSAPLAASLLLLASLGCSQGLLFPAAATAVPVSGNWQISSSDSSASLLPSISGELAGAGASVTGTLHSNSNQACVAPSTSIQVAGSANAANVVTLTGGNVAGGTLQVTGTLSADGKSLSDATYNVAGGTCAFSSPAKAKAQFYSPITGNYAGSFSDPYGQVLSITASLTQTPASDTSGNFQLSGTASLGANPCFASPATVSNSQVTGGSFTLTYTDPSQANSVTASGTFSTDGSTLTVTNWVLSGACGPDSGTGLLTR